MTNELNVQTRSEETGLRMFATVKEAIQYAQENTSVWKVSFTTETGERVRLVKVEGTSVAVFEYSPIV